MIDNLKFQAKKIIVIGAFHEIIELAEDNEIEISGMIDNNLTNNYRGYNILCSDKEAPNLSKSFKDIPVLITPDIPAIRKKTAYFLQ